MATPSLRRVNQAIPPPGARLPAPSSTSHLPMGSSNASHSPSHAQVPQRGASAVTHTPSLVESLMRESADGVDVSGRVAELKRAILTDGINADDTGMSSHRIYIWLVLLRTPVLAYDSYAALLRRGASASYAKINDDTHRTLATDPLFARRVSQNSIARLLNTIAWALEDLNRARQEDAGAAQAADATSSTPPAPIFSAQPSVSDITSTNTIAPDLPAASSTPTVPTDAALQPPAAPSDPSSAQLADGMASLSLRGTENTTQAPDPTTLPPLPSDPPQAPFITSRMAMAPLPAPYYVQGMNVLSAPFLYAARSEPQAHAALLTLLTKHIPAYVTPTMSGVHAGLALLDKLLALLDPGLFAFLEGRGLNAAVYAFPAVLTLSACTPPLPEVLILWDFLLSWGAHLNLLAVVAQLHLIRVRVMKSDSPARELRNLGPLRARKVLDLVVAFVGRVPGGLWEEMVSHTGGGP